VRTDVGSLFVTHPGCNWTHNGLRQESDLITDDSRGAYMRRPTVYSSAPLPHAGLKSSRQRSSVLVGDFVGWSAAAAKS
jgi:hypothetical protein